MNQPDAINDKLKSEAAESADDAYPFAGTTDEEIYIEGYLNAAYKHAWVDAKERLPMVGNPVLAWDGRDVFIADHGEAGWEADEVGTVHDVTHWMELPKPPNQNKA